MLKWRKRKCRKVNEVKSRRNSGIERVWEKEYKNKDLKREEKEKSARKIKMEENRWNREREKT